MATTERRRDSPLQTLRLIPAEKVQRAYDLHAADEIIGCVRWPNLLGSVAEAEYGSQRRTFKRGGFVRPHVTVRAPCSEGNLAVIELSLGGGSGTLRTDGGPEFRWQQTDGRSHRCNFIDEDGTELLGVELEDDRPAAFWPDFDCQPRTGTVEVSATGAKTPELGLLLTLDWYLITLIAEDEAAAATVICLA